MFQYTNSQHMGVGAVPTDFQRWADVFWSVYNQVVIDFRLDQNTATAIAQTINNPETIMQCLNATCVNGKVDQLRLYHDLTVYIQREAPRFQPQYPPQNAFAQQSPFPPAQHNVVFSNSGQGGFPTAGPQGRAQSFGRQPQMMSTQPQTTTTTISSMAAKLKGQPKIQQQDTQQTTQTQQVQKPVKPAIYIVNECAPPIEEEMVDIGVPDDAFVKIHTTSSAKYKDQPGAPTLLIHLTLNYPCATKIPSVRFLRLNYPEFFATDKWVITMDTQRLMVDTVDSSKGEIIKEAFSRAAEKSKVVEDYNSFASVFLPSLKNMGDDGYVRNLLFRRYCRFLAFYFRNPENAKQFPELDNWADVTELYKPGSPFMRPWVNANPLYQTNLHNIMLSAINSVFPGGKSPIVDAFNPENRGMVAGIPLIHLKHGKYAFRDFAIADKAALESFEQELKTSYIIRKEPMRLILTNIPEEEVVSDTEITVVPAGTGGVSYQLSLMHFANLHLTTLDTADIERGMVYHMGEILGCDGDDPSDCSWTKYVGQNIQLDMIYFD